MCYILYSVQIEVKVSMADPDNQFLKLFLLLRIIGTTLASLWKFVTLS